MVSNIPIIEMLDKSEAVELGKANDILEPIAELNIFRTLLKHPTMAASIGKLLGVFLFQNKLDPKLRELIILRTGWLYGCNYEWTHHYEIAKAFKVDEDKIMAIRSEKIPSDIFDKTELIIIRCVDEVKEFEYVTDATLKELADSFIDNKDELTLEVIGVATTWKLITQILRSLNIKLEDHLSDWPPDGKSIDG